MLRLTLRDPRDGALLARVVARDGRPFVLDLGDPRVIADAALRIQHGFSVWREGKLVTVHPNDASLLEELASFYVADGILVAFEEPTWTGRADAPDLPDVPEGDDVTEFLEDDATELVALDDLPTVDDALSPVPTLDELMDPPWRDLGDEDLETEERPWLERELRAKAVDLPDLGPSDDPTELLTPDD